MFCVFCPGQLVEIIDKKTGKLIHADLLLVKMDNIHAIEIFVASVILLW